ncbi:tectonic-1 [Neosynchiropus ocellatus]
MAASLATRLACLCFALAVQNTSSSNETVSSHQEDLYNTTNGNLNVTGFDFSSEENTAATPTEPGPAGGSDLPPESLPVSGQLPSPDIEVGKLCPCDQHQDACDINCCCDRACREALPLFTSCLVGTVRGSGQLCSQEVALYSLSTRIDGYSELQSAAGTENSRDIFCIRSQNRVDTLSHRSPVLPTDRNFDSIFHRFSSYLFRQPQSGPLESTARLEETSGYKFGDVMLTVEKSGLRGRFHLPVSSVSADCVDRSPAGFLVEQISRCARRLSLEQDCVSLPALRMDTYTSVRLSADKSEDSPVVDVKVDSVAMQHADGDESELGVEDILSPVLVSATSCANVVLKVVFLVVCSPAGEIKNASVSVKLGVVSADQLPLQQDFQVTFVQESNENVAVGSSGNPGYQVGLPLVSARSTTKSLTGVFTGLTRSVNPEDTLSILLPGEEQDCLQGLHQYVPVRFDLDFISGCTLRLVDIANCSMLSERILEVLRGPSYPQYVSSFGNSPLDNPLDWVPVRSSYIPVENEECSIPVSRHLEVEWTKYGSLMNPQAQIVSVKELIYTNTSSLGGGSDLLSIQSSVSFVPVSAPATAGYRATPTIDAKLPQDFFFPFV